MSCARSVYGAQLGGLYAAQEKRPCARLVADSLGASWCASASRRATDHLLPPVRPAAPSRTSPPLSCPATRADWQLLSIVMAIGLEMRLACFPPPSSEHPRSAPLRRVARHPPQCRGITEVRTEYAATCTHWPVVCEFVRWSVSLCVSHIELGGAPGALLRGVVKALLGRC